MKTIKEYVSGNKTVNFVYFRKDHLWYTTECGFEFPVPVEDVGDATFNSEERAMLMMRYIRKHIKNIEDGKEECGDITEALNDRQEATNEVVEDLKDSKE